MNKELIGLRNLNNLERTLSRPSR